MQIVIDIPDNEYILVKNLDDFHINRDNIVSYVRNGTPLPKGHGDLIDRKVLLNNGYQMEPVEMWYGIKYPPTIIEADKE